MQALRAPLPAASRPGGSTVSTSVSTSASTSARTGAGTGADAHAFRALVGQVSRHSGARVVSPWTGEAQAEPDRQASPQAEPGVPRPAIAATGPAAASGAQTLPRECVLALVPVLCGAPREGRFQLLLPGGRTLEISYRSSDRRAVVRLHTRHRATARQLARQAESLAIRLGRECLKEVLVLVDDADTDADTDANSAANPRANPDPDPEPPTRC
jgi:hypothetical protein